MTENNITHIHGGIILYHASVHLSILYTVPRYDVSTIHHLYAVPVRPDAYTLSEVAVEAKTTNKSRNDVKLLGLNLNGLTSLRH